jgi:probable F420-dependent oxidoreductase
MLTSSGLRLGIALPQVFREGVIDTGLIRDYSVRAEALGYQDLWLTERIVGGESQLEPVTLLTFAAACTSRIRLGVSVIILNQRNPIQLAKALASLDQLSHGRLTVGVGLGNGTALYPAFGISENRPVARFTEALRVMRELWSQDTVALENEFWRLSDVSIAPKPVQQPLPVWLGGHAPAALRRAVRLGDGWMGAGATRIDDFYSEIAQVREFMRETGREEPGFTLSKRIYISVDRDERQAQERLEAGLKAQYGRYREGVGLAGTPNHCVEVLRSMREAGLHHLLLHPFSNSLDQLELLTAEVAPEL